MIESRRFDNIANAGDNTALRKIDHVLDDDTMMPAPQLSCQRPQSTLGSETNIIDLDRMCVSLGVARGPWC